MGLRALVFAGTKASLLKLGESVAKTKAMKIAMNKNTLTNSYKEKAKMYIMKAIRMKRA